MLHFQLNPSQIKKTQVLLVAIATKNQKIKTFSETKQQYMANQAMISNIGASTRIENAILTDIEIEWIDTIIASEDHEAYKNQELYIKHKFSQDKARSIEEVAGYRDAIKIVMNLYHDFYPLSLHQIKGLHRELLKYYSQAQYHYGDFKTQPNSVIETNHQTGTKRVVLKTADPGTITETSIADLVSWYNDQIKSSPWPVAVATELVFRFLAIHPFQDGNGRLARLLFFLALLSAEDENWEKVVPFMAWDRNIEQQRTKYYLVLRKSSGGQFRINPAKYQYAYLYDFMSEILSASLRNCDHYSNKYDNFCKLSQTAQNILMVFKDEPERNIKISNILAKLNLPRRTTLYSLNQLKKFGFIQKLGAGAGVRYQLIF